jgi:hypothetical protein
VRISSKLKISIFPLRKADNFEPSLELSSNFLSDFLKTQFILILYQYHAIFYFYYVTRIGTTMTIMIQTRPVGSTTFWRDTNDSTWIPMESKRQPLLSSRQMNKKDLNLQTFLILTSNLFCYLF